MEIDGAARGFWFFLLEGNPGETAFICRGMFSANVEILTKTNSGLGRLLPRQTHKKTPFPHSFEV